MSTLEALFAKIDTAIPYDLIGQAEVPVLTGPQRQGDVGIFPRARIGRAELAAFTPVPREGVAVVRGEAGGNTHWLLAEGDVMWKAHTATGDDDLTLGILNVADGAVAHLIHEEEHGANGIGPGCYVLTGKREQADIVRRVAD